jgi:uncharacterized protein YgiM (DUF1202 family)
MSSVELTRGAYGLFMSSCKFAIRGATQMEPLLMKRFIVSAAVAAALSLPMMMPQSQPAQAQRYDCAHGPDTYRVRGVANWDVLNIRSGPSSKRRIIGEIPPTGTGVHCLGPCRGNWCRISWRGIVGWTHMRYLGE